jgi:putative pyruvate formate lyase activating enzyme
MAAKPSYITLHDRKDLGVRIQALHQILGECRLCPRECRVNRIKGETGTCRAGGEMEISSSFPHFGEEPPLIGRHGSGTVFFTHCNLRCAFCQNYDITHLGRGETAYPADLAGIMLRLQGMGCHNINFVTPTHYVSRIVASLPEAVAMGLHLPIVYNCSGYESLEVLSLLDGIVDIYMPDAKFMDMEQAKRYCNAPDYPDVMRAALKEMHRQVGDLRIGPDGIAERGLLIRHLLMPGGVSSTEAVLEFIARELSVHSYVNLMDQYRPEYRADEYPEIDRRITRKEYLEAVRAAKRLGLYRGF